MIVKLARASWHMGGMIFRYRKILSAVTIVELSKKYSGSALGQAWLVIYPLLLLSIYLFVYLVIFKMRFPGFSELDYTIYVFTGLIPYIGMSEALTSGAVSIRQNMHLVKNVMLPIELIPVRAVLVSMASQIASIGLVLALIIWNGSLSSQVILLPGIIILQMLFLIGCVLVLSALVVALPDIANFVNLGMLLLMFISPIGFKPDMVPPNFQAIIFLNPVHYMTDAFRAVMLSDYPMHESSIGLFAAMCLIVFALGCAFFRRFKNALVDYE